MALFPEDQTLDFRPVLLLSILAGCVACAVGDANETSDPTGITISSPGGTTGLVRDSALSTGPVSTSPGIPSNSTGPGLSGLALASDDFTHYGSTAGLQNNITTNAGGTGNTVTALYHDGLNARWISLDNTVLYNGHPTMKYDQPSGTASTPQLGVYFPAVPHIWYRIKVRFSPGFTTTGTIVNSANAYKLLSWGWDGPNGSGRLEITNTTGYEIYENVQVGPSLTGGGQYLEAGSISTEWTDAGWYDYVIEVDHTQPTGVIRLWRAKDGQTPVYQGQVSEKMNDGTMMPPLTNISVGLNFNQIRTQSQAVWWGEWEVVDGTQHPNPFGLSH